MLADIVPPATTEEEAGYLAGRSRFGKSLVRRPGLVFVVSPDSAGQRLAEIYGPM
jgi:hypothetical protein